MCNAVLFFGLLFFFQLKVAYGRSMPAGLIAILTIIIMYNNNRSISLRVQPRNIYSRPLHLSIPISRYIKITPGKKSRKLAHFLLGQTSNEPFPSFESANACPIPPVESPLHCLIPTALSVLVSHPSLVTCANYSGALRLLPVIGKFTSPSQSASSANLATLLSSLRRGILELCLPRACTLTRSKNTSGRVLDVKSECITEKQN